MELSVVEAVKVLEQPGAVYLDVRSTDEYDQGHPEGAWNIPILHARPQGMQPNAEFEVVARAVLPRNVPIVVGCKSGQRSAMAVRVLRAFGQEQAVNMAGGFHGAGGMLGRPSAPGWLQLGLPSTSEPTPGRTWEELRALA